MIVDRDMVEVTIHERDDSGAWQVRVPRMPEETVAFAGLDAICKVPDLYENTCLDPHHTRPA